MKKRLLAFALSATMVLSCMSVNVHAEGAEGNDTGSSTAVYEETDDGEKNDEEIITESGEKPEIVGTTGESDGTEEPDQAEYIEIRTAKDLYNVRNNLDGKYKLMNDIDLTEATTSGGIYDFNENGWKPIGSDSNYNANPFTGEFDGNNHIIYGLSIKGNNGVSNSSKLICIGLFAKNEGTIKNVRLKDINICWETTNDIYCGGLVGQNEGNIENVYIYESKINVSKKEGYVHSINGYQYSTSGYVGGVAGSNKSNVVNCYAECSFDTVASGGYIDYKPHSSDNKIGFSYVNVGGISNNTESGALIEKCYSSCNNNNSLFYDHSFSYMTAFIDSAGINGGDVGTVESCYSTEGYELSNHYSIAYGGVVKNSYSIGKGKVQGSGSASNCYYLNSVGDGFTGWIGLNEAQMQDSSFFEGFDFDNVWRMSDETVYKYPQLRAIRNGITGVEIISEPTNEFVVGTKLKYENAVARVTREDGTFEDIILTPENTSGGSTATTGTKTVTFTYKGVSASFDIDVKPVRVKEISIDSLPNKLNYVVGQPFDQTGLKVNSIYNNGTTKNCEDYAISEVDSSTPGTKTVTISYNGKTATFDVVYEEKKITSIEVTTQPSKTVYTRGEAFDKTGMVVKANYNDDTSEAINGYTVSSIASCGDKVKLDVTYGDKATEIYVKVNHKYNAGERTLEPTCEADGNIRYTCQYCGYAYDEVISAIGHEYGEPEWTWDGVFTATAAFVCKNDSSHVKSYTGKITSAVTKEATCTTSGIKTYTAKINVDGKEYTSTKTEKIPFLTHDYSAAPSWKWDGTKSCVAIFTCKRDMSHVKRINATLSKKVVKAATCTAKGLVEITATVELNGKTFTSSKTDSISPLGHKYALSSWSWSGSTAKAVFRCTHNKDHKQVVSATVTSKVTKQPTCTTSGSRLYTAKVVFEGKTYTATRSVKIEPKGHAYGKPTWKWNGTVGAKATFVCARDKSHIKVVKAKVTSAVTTKATVYAAGIRTYTASATIKDKTYTTKKNIKIYVFNKNKTGVQVYNGKLYYVKNGVVLKSFNGFAVYNNEYRYFTNGVFDKSLSGLYKGTINGKNSWYAVSAGKYNKDYKGFLSNTYGWWYCTSGTIDFGVTGIYKGSVNGQTADWYVNGGKVTFTDTVARGKDGMYVIRNGRVDYSFTGIASNSEGKWYCVNGKVDTGFSGTVTTVNCIKYTIVNGKVTREEEDTAAELKILLNILYDNTTALNYLSSAVKGISGASTTYGYYYRITYYMDYFKTAKAYIQQAENRCGNITRFATLKNYLHQAAYYIPTTVSNSSASISAFLNCLQTNVYYMELVSNEITRLKNILK